MKQLRKLLPIVLAVAQIGLSVSCASNKPDLTGDTGTASDGSPTIRTSVSTSVPTFPEITTDHDTYLPTVPTIPPSDPVPTIPTAPVPDDIPIFVKDIRDAQPKALSASERKSLMDELEAVLVKKSYSDFAKNLVRETGSAILDGQPQFQSLFGFLKPHDSATYFRKYFLVPLDAMVDTLRCCGEECPDDLQWLRENYGDDPGFSGLTSESEKSIIVILGSAEENRLILVHELYHAATLRENFMAGIPFYFELLEGSATFYQLTLMGGEECYRSLGYLERGARSYPDPDDSAYRVDLCGNGSWDYGLWGNQYFKLMALTDFDTMDLFLLPRGELEIRKNLVERYGEEGGIFYDRLESSDTFEEVIENEARFLRLFTGRMEEITTPQECVSYFQLYRLYRRIFAARYFQWEDGNGETHDLELAHPMIDYASADRKMAGQLLKWKVLNADALTDSEQGILAFALAANYTAHNYDEANRCRDSYLRAPITLALGEYSFHYAENNDPIICVRLPEGGSEMYCYSIDGQYVYYLG